MIEPTREQEGRLKDLADWGLVVASPAESDGTISVRLYGGGDVRHVVANEDGSVLDRETNRLFRPEEEIQWNRPI